MTGLKNISKAEVLTLKDEVAYQKGQVVSKTLAQNAALSVTLFSFDKCCFANKLRKFFKQSAKKKWRLKGF